MIVDEEQESWSVGHVFRGHVAESTSPYQAFLRVREAERAYCRWAEQASKIRVRQFNWDNNSLRVE